MKHPRLGWLITFLALTAAAQAQLAVWNVNGQNAGATNPLAADPVGSGVASASITLGSGVAASSAADTFGGTGFDTTSLASAIAIDDFLSITLTPGAGFALDLSNLSFNSGVGTAVTNFNVSVQSSATGFSTGSSIASFSFSTQGAPAQSITLSGISELQGITSAIEFRLFGWRDSTGSSTFRIRDLSGSDLVINGTVSAIPEPSTYAAILGGVALVGAWFRRRALAAAGRRRAG